MGFGGLEEVRKQSWYLFVVPDQVTEGDGSYGQATDPTAVHISRTRPVFEPLEPLDPFTARRSPLISQPPRGGPDQ